MIRELKCHTGVGPKVTGIALVADDNFSARYDLDRMKGVFSRPQHKLAGQSYKDRILVFNTAKGGVATAWMLHEMAAQDIVPKAILFSIMKLINDYKKNQFIHFKQLRLLLINFN